MTRLQVKALVAMRGKKDVSASQLAHLLFGKPRSHFGATAILSALFNRGFLTATVQEGYEQGRWVYTLNERGETAAKHLDARELAR